MKILSIRSTAAGRLGSARRLAFLPLMALALLLAGHQAHAGGGHGSVMDLIEKANRPYDDQALDAAIDVPEDRVRAQVKSESGPFWVKTRKEEIGRYRCSRCHTAEEAAVELREGARQAHGDIEIVHGEQKQACRVCHHDSERDFLVDKEGNKIDFDHAYQLCGQCHFRQKKDWIGGAHGKRDRFWAGKRVVWNCTSCHDPHSPSFKKRLPTTYSRPLSQ